MRVPAVSTCVCPQRLPTEPRLSAQEIPGARSLGEASATPQQAQQASACSSDGFMKRVRLPRLLLVFLCLIAGDDSKKAFTCFAGFHLLQTKQAGAWP